MTESMALEATIKVCDPIRVPANDPIFNERDPAARAALTPAIWFPSNPVRSDPLSSAPPAPASEQEQALRDARREAAFYKSMHQRSAARVKLLQLQLSQAEARCRAKAAARILQ